MTAPARPRALLEEVERALEKALSSAASRGYLWTLCPDLAALRTAITTALAEREAERDRLAGELPALLRRAIDSDVLLPYRLADDERAGLCGRLVAVLRVFLHGEVKR
jgi:hypothetical protein